jgi:aspartyl/glutamyl-tRNA(Asn/Gln) amidotransferase C subunit
MTEVSATLVEKVAALARLRLGPDEIHFYQEQFGRILAYFQTIEAAQDRLAPEFRSDILGAPLREREDTAIDAGLTGAAMSQAPQWAGDAFQVPRIVE